MNRFTPITAVSGSDLNWAHKPSPLTWSVMLYGGTNPRTGFPQPQLEFQFYAGHYTRERIEQRAADMAEREHRTHWAVREPADDFLSIVKGHKQFNRQERRVGGR